MRISVERQVRIKQCLRGVCELVSGHSVTLAVSHGDNIIDSDLSLNLILVCFFETGLSV